MSFVENDPVQVAAAKYDAEEREHYATDEMVARVGYMAIRELERADGQYVPGWEQLTESKRADLIAGVNYIFDHPSVTCAAQHDAWLARNTHRLGADDPRRKPYAELGYLARLKIALWRNICHAFVG